VLYRELGDHGPEVIPVDFELPALAREFQQDDRAGFAVMGLEERRACLILGRSISNSWRHRCSAACSSCRGLVWMAYQSFMWITVTEKGC